MEGGRFRLDWGECNGRAMGVARCGAGGLGVRKERRGRGPPEGMDKQAGPCARATAASVVRPPRCCGGGSAASARARGAAAWFVATCHALCGRVENFFLFF
jgi:hypothetical protein